MQRAPTFLEPQVTVPLRATKAGRLSLLTGVPAAVSFGWPHYRARWEAQVRRGMGCATGHVSQARDSRCGKNTIVLASFE